MLKTTLLVPIDNCVGTFIRIFLIDRVINWHKPALFLRDLHHVLILEQLTQVNCRIILVLFLFGALLLLVVPMGKIDDFGNRVILLVLWQRRATLGAALREYHCARCLLMTVIATSYTQKNKSIES